MNLEQIASIQQTEEYKSLYYRILNEIGILTLWDINQKVNKYATGELAEVLRMNLENKYYEGEGYSVACHKH